MAIPVCPGRKDRFQSVWVGLELGDEDWTLRHSPSTTCRESALSMGLGEARTHLRNADSLTGQYPWIYVAAGGALGPHVSCDDRLGELHKRMAGAIVVALTGEPLVLKRFKYTFNAYAPARIYEGYAIRCPVSWWERPYLLHMALGVMRDAHRVRIQGLERYFLPAATDEEVSAIVSGDKAAAARCVSRMLPNLSCISVAFGRGRARTLAYLITGGVEMGRTYTVPGWFRTERRGPIIREYVEAVNPYMARYWDCNGSQVLQAAIPRTFRYRTDGLIQVAQ